MRSPSSPPPRNRAERRAARWYRLHGYRILDTNCWVAGNELDLVQFFTATGKPVSFGCMHLLRFENGLATD